ncbi:MAG: hypothetical protein IPL08_10490 [Saprospiraceae bacterium]|nr:hypothetical protein [Saprospiraceae bacterium]
MGNECYLIDDSGLLPIKTRYVTAATCGTIIAGTTAPAACVPKCWQQCSNLPAAPVITMPLIPV